MQAPTACRLRAIQTAPTLARSGASSGGDSKVCLFRGGAAEVRRGSERTARRRAAGAEQGGGASVPGSSPARSAPSGQRWVSLSSAGTLSSAEPWLTLAIRFAPSGPVLDRRGSADRTRLGKASEQV